MTPAARKPPPLRELVRQELAHLLAELGIDTNAGAGLLPESSGAGASSGGGEDTGAGMGAGGEDTGGGMGAGGEDAGSGAEGAGGDSATPSYQTVDSAGRIGANFTGDIHAQGLDLDAGTTTTPPTTDRVRWLRTSDGALVADLFGYQTGVGQGGNLDVQASDPDAAATADLVLTARHAANGAGATLQLNSGLDLATFQWGSDGRSSFLQLVSLANLAISLGSSSATFTAAAQSGAVAVGHSLGRTPLIVLFDAAGSNFLSARVSAKTTTTFTFNGFTTQATAITSTVTYNWLAIG